MFQTSRPQFGFKLPPRASKKSLFPLSLSLSLFLIVQIFNGDSNLSMSRQSSPERHAPLANRSQPSNVFRPGTKAGKKEEGRKYTGKSIVRRKQGQFPGARRAVVISFVGWRGSCRYKLPAGSVTRAAPIVNRTNPASAASCRANFREPTYIPLSRVAERGIQFVAVSSIRGWGRERGGKDRGVSAATCRTLPQQRCPNSLWIKGDGNSLAIRESPRVNQGQVRNLQSSLENRVMHKMVRLFPLRAYRATLLNK